MPSFNEILQKIDKAVNRFNRRIPAAQQEMYDEISLELKRLDLRGGRIKTTVANVKVIASIKNKLQRLILTPDYIQEVKVFAKAFNEITKLQNEYWRSIEPTFRPTPLLREIRQAAIKDTVSKLTQAGIGNTISEQIADILRTNITTGGQYKDLQKQLQESLTDTQKSDGLLTKFAKTITVTSLNTYNAQYTQSVSSDLGFEWYAWQGTEIMTSRGFCQYMVESNRYFHVSQIPNLLKGLDVEGNRMKYKDNKTGEMKTVEIYAKTGLPNGFIEGTNAENFLIRRGGWSCSHQARPVSERLIKAQAPEYYEQVIQSAAYKRWKGRVA